MATPETSSNERCYKRTGRYIEVVSTSQIESAMWTHFLVLLLVGFIEISTSQSFDVLNKILSGYDPRVRPATADNLATKVEIMVTLMSLVNVVRTRADSFQLM